MDTNMIRETKSKKQSVIPAHPEAPNLITISNRVINLACSRNWNQVNEETVKADELEDFNNNEILVSVNITPCCC